MKSIKYKPYYKKVDRSMMDWGLTIPNSHINDLTAGSPLKPGTARKIYIVWDKDKFKVELRHVKRKKANPVYQIRWDNNRELLAKLRKTFIQSYVILKSQKELFDIEKGERKHFRTSLLGGQQEVLILQPKNKTEVSFDIFIKIENEWNTLFRRLAEENVFGWLFNREKKYLITRSTNWIKVKHFNKHSSANNVIYYLAHTKKRLLYIGKAEVLGKRVRPGVNHQSMPADWDLFKYDTIKPEYAGLLERIEDHTIRSFAAILQNKRLYPSLNIGSWILSNANWKKLH